MNTKLQIFPSFSNHKSIAKVGIEDVISIMQNKDFEDITLQARHLKQERDTFIQNSYEWNNLHKSYTEKKSKLKATVYTTVFKDGYGSLTNGINYFDTTGLVFLDVDQKDEAGQMFTPEHFPQVVSQAYVLNNSLGGQGYHLILRASGLTESNYRSTCEGLATNLGIYKFIDKSCITRPAQPTALPYCPNVIYNANSAQFSAIEPKCENVPTPWYTTTKEIQYVEVGTKYNDLLDRVVFTEEEKKLGYAVRWEGVSFIKCHIPFNPIKDGRKRMLSSYARNYMFHNPSFDKNRLLRSLRIVNLVGCEIPKDEVDLHLIANNVFKQIEKGTLKPQIWYKTRKIIFDPGFRRTYDEKMAIVHYEVRKKWKSIGEQKLYKTIEGWDWTINGKITIRSLKRIGKMGRKTIDKYIPEFKQHILELNKIYITLHNDKRRNKK